MKLFERRDLIYLKDDHQVLVCVAEDEEMNTVVFGTLRFYKNGDSYICFDNLVAYANDDSVNTLDDLGIENLKNDREKAISLL